MDHPTPRNLARALFVPAEDGYFNCRLCFGRRKQAPGTGYSNLIEHLTRSHGETYLDEFRTVQQREGSLNHFVKGDDFSRTVYHWLDWTIMENRELTMCEKVKTRKYTHLKPLSTKTLRKHMFALEELVQRRVKNELAGKQLGLIIDAWTEQGTHFLAVIAVSSADKYLLCFSTLENEADMSADSIISLLDDLLDNYAIDVSQLCFYVCDNAAVNVAIAKKTKVPMIGCASHRFNLAVQKLMEPYSELLDKIHQLMAKLNTIKNRHYLRESDALMPVFRNATRWSSTFAMVHRYFAIVDKIDQVDDDLADHVPSARENVRLKALLEDLKNLESVNKALQTERGVSLRDVRKLFDHVIEHYPTTGHYLASDAAIVKFPDFENGLVKLLGGEQDSLSRAERAAVAKLLRPDVTAEPEADDSKKKSFAAEALGKDTPKKNERADLAWIPPTSNDVERLFSRAGLVFTRLRRSMTPMTLETMMFLQYNRALWDASAVAEAIETECERKRQRVE